MDNHLPGDTSYQCPAKATPGVTSQHANVTAKVLQSDFQRFSTDTAATFASNANGSNRKALPAEAPPTNLGMDMLLQLEIERLGNGKGNRQYDPTVLDRELLDSRHSWSKVIIHKTQLTHSSAVSHQVPHVGRQVDQPNSWKPLPPHTRVNVHGTDTSISGSSSSRIDKLHHYHTYIHIS